MASSITVPNNAYKLQVRVAGVAQTGCNGVDPFTSVLSLSWSNSASSGSATPFTPSSTSFVTSFTFIDLGNGKSTPTTMTLTFQYSSDFCTDITISDISAVAFLCDSSCNSCTSAGVCSCISPTFLKDGACTSSCPGQKMD